MPYYFAIPNEPGVVGPLTESSSGRYSSRRLGAADLYSTNSNFVMQMDVPGITSEHLTVELIEHGKVLKVAGEKKCTHSSDPNAKYSSVERSYGSFNRTFRLSDDADPSSLVANLSDGVLTVTIDKIQPVHPEVVSVRINTDGENVRLHTEEVHDETGGGASAPVDTECMWGSQDESNVSEFMACTGRVLRPRRTKSCN